MMEAVPLTLRQANAYVSEHHRHHKPARGCLFCIGAKKDGDMVGVVIVGRPVSRHRDDGFTAEATRVCTDGTFNACSFLLGRAMRAAKAVGYRRFQTYILNEEDGASLRAVGLEIEAVTQGGSWNRGARKGRREDQPMGPKKRAAKAL